MSDHDHEHEADDRAVSWSGETGLDPAEVPGRTYPVGVGGVPIQRRVSGGDAAPSGDAVRSAAQHGLSGGGGRLPFHDRIQRLFGRHDVGDVQAHTGDAARAGARGMGAEAYATGNHVVFGGTPDLRTAAHEAAHVVQQRAGVDVAGGVGAVGDAYERHADAVADRVVAGESAEALLDQHSPSRGAAVSVQRTITITPSGKPTRDYPGTYNKITVGKSQADQVISAAVAKAPPGTGTPAVQDAWGRIARNPKKTYNVDTDTNRQKLVDALVKSLAKSKQSSAAKAQRDQDLGPLTQGLLKQRPDLELTGGIRPKLQAKKMAKFGPPSGAQRGAPRAQVHAATVLFYLLGSSAEEVQVSLPKDPSGGAIVASNSASHNSRVAAVVKQRKHLISLAITARTRRLAEIGNAPKPENDRVVRHASKLIARLDRYLADGAPVTVPQQAERAGTHAELRIVDSSAYRKGGNRMPAGTKYPCAACYIYLITKGETPGPEMGPMWLSNAALAKMLGKKQSLGHLGKEAHQVGTKLLQGFQKAEADPHHGKIGHGRKRDNTYDIEANADSATDLDEKGQEDMAKMIAATSADPSAQVDLGGASDGGGKAKKAKKNNNKLAEAAVGTPSIASFFSKKPAANAGPAAMESKDDGLAQSGDEIDDMAKLVGSWPDESEQDHDIDFEPEESNDTKDTPAAPSGPSGLGLLSPEVLGDDEVDDDADEENDEGEEMVDDKHEGANVKRAATSSSAGEEAGVIAEGVIEEEEIEEAEMGTAEAKGNDGEEPEQPEQPETVEMGTGQDDVVGGKRKDGQDEASSRERARKLQRRPGGGRGAPILDNAAE